ncbi:MAG: YHS domain-containing protein [Candidatus Micrarchaeota archaeon]|nr:YHS domain-containing protein [Candidatus Micrarchaeota archaeon]
MRDLVCGMEVSESSKFASSYKGRKYYFCSGKCKEAFDKSPDKYAKADD